MVESFYHVSTTERGKLQQLSNDSHKESSNLLPKQAVNQKLAADFTCGICFNIVSP